MKNRLAKCAKLSDNGIYIAWRSLIYKVGMYTKKILWEKEIAGLGSSIVVKDGLVYAYSSQFESFVYALQASTGALIWSTAVIPYQVEGSVQINELLAITMSDTIVYVVSRGGTVYALNASSGMMLWHCETVPFEENHLGTLALTIANNIVYYASNNYFYAIDAFQSRNQWITLISHEQTILTQILIDNTIYISADLDPLGSYVYAISAENGSLFWCSNLLPDPIFETPVFVDGYLYYVGGTTIYALNATNGTLFWEHFVGCTNYLQPCVEGNILYICLRGSYQQEYVSSRQAESGMLLALHCKDGSLIWSRHIEGSPTMFHVKHGLLYVCSAAGNNLYVFDAKDGTALWQIENPLENNQSDLIRLTGFGADLIVLP